MNSYPSFFFFRPTSTPFSTSKPVEESPYCYATANLVAGIENLTVKESSDKKSTQKMIRTVTVDPQVPSAPSSRLSLEHHAHSHDFMNHLHGCSPHESEIHPVRMSLGKPPRFSTGSAITANVVEPIDNLESFATYVFIEFLTEKPTVYLSARTYPFLLPL